MIKISDTGCTLNLMKENMISGIFNFKKYSSGIICEEKAEEIALENIQIQRCVMRKDLYFKDINGWIIPWCINKFC